MAEDNTTILSVGAECTISGAPEPLRKIITTKLTCENPQYRDAKKYGRWVGKRLKPQLYFFREEPDGSLIIPRGYARQAVYTCRNYLGTERLQIKDQRREVKKINFTFIGELRPYQKKARDEVLQNEFGVLESGTGSGKTVIALAVIAARKQPTLILVHTKELLYQWVEKIQTFLDMRAGMIGDGHFDVQPITVAIVNSARRRLQDLPGQFGQICVDECHRVPATLFTDVVTAFDCRFMLGLSATAYRRDGLTCLIYYYLGERAWRIDPQELESSGAVLKPEFIQKETGFTYVYRGDYQDLMKALTGSKTRNQRIIEDILTEAEKGRRTVLVVSDRVAHCEALVKGIAERDINGRFRTAMLTGKMKADERSQLVEAIHNGAVDILIATLQLIGEGFDCPGLRVLILTTPIKFTGRLLQVVGRVLRPEQGKKPVVYDYIDQCGLLQKSARERRQVFEDEEDIQEMLFSMRE
ncbi:MAG: DEAD/DEAH box helicase [Proteobacteria bacterium]|nr:DEAD/DEAH box helicase [Pseudomonadota bacterium]